jgi:hypothetical protein
VNERTRTVLAIAILVIGLTLGYVLFLKPYFTQLEAVDKVRTANSTWTVTMQQYLMQGPISEQTYRINNDNGKVTMFYSATNRDGTVTKQFTVPLAGPQATFLFEALRADGIWELLDKPVRSNPRDEYVFFIRQTLGDEGGQRAFGFSDPIFWATTKGREYPVNVKAMNKSNPLAVTSRPLRDPRYLKIVQLMETFGPPSVQQAEATIRAELAASNGRHVTPTRAR